MDKLAKHSWPSIDTLVIIVSLTVIVSGSGLCIDPSRGPATHVTPCTARPPLVPGSWSSASVVGHVTTYHRLSMWG